jgi:hypothetical protein
VTQAIKGGRTGEQIIWAGCNGELGGGIEKVRVWVCVHEAVSGEECCKFVMCTEIGYFFDKWGVVSQIHKLAQSHECIMTQRSRTSPLAGGETR